MNVKQKINLANYNTFTAMSDSWSNVTGHVQF